MNEYFSNKMIRSVPWKPTLIYRMDVCGHPGGDVECMESYLSRLSSAHFLKLTAFVRSVLSSQESIADVEARHLQMLAMSSREDHERHRSVVHWSAERMCAGVIERINPGLDLDVCFARGLTDVFSINGLASCSLKYCPECLGEETDPYHRLYWQIDATEVCAVHGHELLTSDSCKGECLPRGERSRRPNICRMCGSIGYLCHGSERLPASEEQMWIANQIRDAIAFFLEDGGRTDSKAVGAGIHRLFELLGDGSPFAAAERLGIPKGTLHGWVSGAIKPNLNRIVRAIAPWRVEIRSLFSGAPVAKRAGVLLPAMEVRRPKPVSKANRIAAMGLALKDGPPPSLQSIAKRLGVDPKTLCLDSAKLSAEIVKAYADYQATKSGALAAHRVERVTDAVKELSAAGKAVTLRAIRDVTGLHLMPGRPERQYADSIVKERQHDHNRVSPRIPPRRANENIDLA